VKFINRLGLALCFLGTVSILAPNSQHILGTFIMAAGITVLIFQRQK
jgi:hypothetical protein